MAPNKRMKLTNGAMGEGAAPFAAYAQLPDFPLVFLLHPMRQWRIVDSALH